MIYGNATYVFLKRWVLSEHWEPHQRFYDFKMLALIKHYHHTYIVTHFQDFVQTSKNILSGF